MSAREASSNLFPYIVVFSNVQIKNKRLFLYLFILTQQHCYSVENMTPGCFLVEAHTYNLASKACTK